MQTNQSVSIASHYFTWIQISHMPAYTPHTHTQPNTHWELCLDCVTGRPDPRGQPCPLTSAPMIIHHHQTAQPVWVSMLHRPHIKVHSSHFIFHLYLSKTVHWKAHCFLCFTFTQYTECNVGADQQTVVPIKCFAHSDTHTHVWDEEFPFSHPDLSSGIQNFITLFYCSTYLLYNPKYEDHYLSVPVARL